MSRTRVSFCSGRCYSTSASPSSAILIAWPLPHVLFHLIALILKAISRAAPKMSGKNSVSKKPLRWNRLKVDWMKF
ncbi:hypothetical protein VNO80_19891 [Phaseolus coccineus]|uniref:Uncharacterized protein n=1 Tax=Phaseolus coccineus TaxID=3886 RepID=A0AAN9MN59_PHACN